MQGLENEITAIWCSALELETISPDDNFVELGGHSALALAIVNEISERLRVDLAPYALFEKPVLADFTEVIRQQVAEAPPKHALRHD